MYMNRWRQIKKGTNLPSVIPLIGSVGATAALGLTIYYQKKNHRRCSGGLHCRMHVWSRYKQPYKITRWSLNRYRIHIAKSDESPWRSSHDNQLRLWISVLEEISADDSRIVTFGIRDSDIIRQRQSYQTRMIDDLSQCSADTKSEYRR